MANFVLVHGGDRDGSLWDKVTPLLRQQGHQVYCPSLQPITDKSATLKGHINQVCELITANHLENIILVGHSYGAMVVTGVTDRLSEKINHLVYIDTAMPKNGVSWFGLFAEIGFDYKQYGFTPDAPCLEQLYFDDEKIRHKPKVYIHCLQSEFIAPFRIIYQTIVTKAEADHWLYFSIDTIHACMLTRPIEIAIILSGIPAALPSEIDISTKS